MMIPTGTVLHVNEVSFAYNSAPVLSDVTFDVAAGEFVSLIGPNGGGKTTLLRLVLGLLKPQRGEVRVLGRRPEAARRLVGYVPQHARVDPQLPMSALDVVLMGRLGMTNRLGPYRRHDKQAAVEALRAVDLEDCVRQNFASLSGGQRQRVMIARAIVSKPTMLLLDEPTSNLDATAEASFYQLLRELNQRMTILIVSHDVGTVSQYVTKVIGINRRVTVYDAEAITGDAIREMYGHDVHMVHAHHDPHEPEQP